MVQNVFPFCSSAGRKITALFANIFPRARAALDHISCCIIIIHAQEAASMVPTRRGNPSKRPIVVRRGDEVPRRLTRLHSMLLSLAAVALLALASDFRRLRRLKATHPYGYEDEALAKLLAASNSRALLNMAEAKRHTDNTKQRTSAVAANTSFVRDGNTVQSLSKQIASAKSKLKENLAGMGSEDTFELQQDATIDESTTVQTDKDAEPLSATELKTAAIIEQKDAINGDNIEMDTSEEEMDAITGVKPADSSAVKENPRPPKLAWLATYPNSGTSYTMHLVQSVSKTAAATNYENEVRKRPLPRVYEEYPAPFPLQDYPYPLPEKFVLVKTHCSGYMTPASSDYGMTSESFEQGCRTTRTWKQYPTEQVGKVVHIVRNPYDNIISNFHYDFNTIDERARLADQAAVQWTSDHPKAPSGFQRYCHDKDIESQKRWNNVNISPSLRDQLSKVICHDKFVAYIQWHNRAFEMCERLGIPTLVFHYEDYEEKFDETVTNLLDFLELPRQDEPKPFKPGHSYRQGYYTNDDRKNFRVLAKQLASEYTWKAISHYFD